MCKFILVSECLIRCTECNRELKYCGDFSTLIAKCPKAPAPTLTLVEKLQNLNKTGETWVAQGHPVTNHDEVNRRLEICKTCDKYDKASESCRLCGCNLNLKTRLESAHCPDTPPKW